MSPELLPGSILSASGCICPFVPDTWALSWCGDSRAKGLSKASLFGVPEASLDQLISTVTEIVADMSDYGFSNVCHSMRAATTLIEAALPGVPELIVYELGLHRTHVAEFCEEALPAPPPPGCACVGECGVLSAVHRNAALSAGGLPLGFEPLVFNGNLSCSWLCNGLERAVESILGIHPNEHGFLPDFESASEAVRYIARDDVGAEPGLWLPWLLVEHSFGSALTSGESLSSGAPARAPLPPP